MTLLLIKLRDWKASIQEPCVSILFTLQLLLVFFVVPIDTNRGGHQWMTQIGLALMSLISVFIVVHPVARAFTVLSLALSLIGIVVGSGFAQHQISQPIGTLSALLYTFTVSMVVGRKIFSEGPVTAHRIRGAILIYLNIAILFALVDNLLVVWVPHAFSFADTGSGVDLGTMIYFSLTTLTSTGYGDITPIHPYARSVANLESVVGQFYLGGLIATLISLHVSYRQNSKDHARG